MRSRGKPAGPSYSLVCKKCGKKFVSKFKSRIYCSRKCFLSDVKKYKTSKERILARRKSAAIRAKKHYHTVFKKKKNWKEIVRERNRKNYEKRSISK